MIPTSRSDFLLEEIQREWKFKFRSAKLGVEFWICRSTTDLPEGEIAFTIAEFVEATKTRDVEILLAKFKFPGSKIKETK